MLIMNTSSSSTRNTTRSKISEISNSDQMHVYRRKTKLFRRLYLKIPTKKSVSRNAQCLLKFKVQFMINTNETKTKHQNVSIRVNEVHNELHGVHFLYPNAWLRTKVFFFTPDKPLGQMMMTLIKKHNETNGHSNATEIELSHRILMVVRCCCLGSTECGILVPIHSVWTVFSAW